MKLSKTAEPLSAFLCLQVPRVLSKPKVMLIVRSNFVVLPLTLNVKRGSESNHSLNLFEDLYRKKTTDAPSSN